MHINFIKKLWNKLKNETGQAVAELAIVLPILLAILCGIIDYGWIITNQNAIDYSAREAARYAIVHAEDASAADAIVSYTKSLTSAAISDSLVVQVTFTNPTNPRLGDVEVEVSGSIPVLTPIAGLFTSGDVVSLHSYCTMKVE